MTGCGALAGLALFACLARDPDDRWQSLADVGRSLAAPGRAAPSRRAFLTGRDRADRVDAELAAAGIRPGDPRLYEPVLDPDAEERP